MTDLADAARSYSSNRRHRTCHRFSRYRALALVLTVSAAVGAGGYLEAQEVDPGAMVSSPVRSAEWNRRFNQELSRFLAGRPILAATQRALSGALEGQALPQDAADAARVVSQVALIVDLAIRRGTPPPAARMRARLLFRDPAVAGSKAAQPGNSAREQIRRQLSLLGGELSSEAERRAGVGSGPPGESRRSSAGGTSGSGARAAVGMAH